jgi:hypothetical protein
MNSRKIQYSSISMVFTVVVVALVLALNLFVTSVEDKLTTKIDLSSKGVISISDATHTALKSLGDNFQTTIYFLTAKDLLESNSDEKIYMIHELAKEYARQYPDCIKIEYKDLNKDMAFLEKFKTQAQSTLTQDKIVVEGKYHSKIYAFSAFFVRDEESGELFAFQGELKFTSAILQTSMNEQPLAVFTTGHGETVKGILSGNGTRQIYDFDVKDINDETLYAELVDAVPLYQMLDNSGFKIKAIDLSFEDIPENTDFVIISNPISDFQGYTKDISADAKTEINKLDDFVNEFRTLAVIVGDKTPASMPNLTELLWEEYGLGFEANHKIQDKNNCVLDGSSGGYDGYSVIGEYVEGQNSLEHAILSNVSSTSVKTVFRDPIRIKIDETLKGAAVSVSTSNSAKVFANNQEIETGSIPLIGVFCNYEFGTNNAMVYKRVFLIGSDEFLSPAYTSGEFGNPYIFYGMARAATNNEIIPDNINYVKLDNEELNAELLTREVAQKWALRVSLYIPAVILVIGGVVWLRRRHL